jgi:membrane protein
MKSNPRQWSELLGALAIVSLVLTLEWSGRGGITASFPRAASKAKIAAHDGLTTKPRGIPISGCWDVVSRTIKRISENELLSAAASVTFYGLLAIFPALTALVSLFGLWADPKAINGQLDMLADIVPSGGTQLITDQINRLTDNPAGGLGLGAVLGLGMALWSANQGTKALFSALNVVNGEKERRGFFVLTAQSLAFTACALVFVLIALCAIVVTPIVLNFIGERDQAGQLLATGRWPAILAIVAMFLACLYRFGPSRTNSNRRWILPGTLCASIAWIALSVGFSWYVAHFDSYDKTYGSLGAAIGFMTWIWLSTTIVLIGAQLNAEAERQPISGN